MVSFNECFGIHIARLASWLLVVALVGHKCPPSNVRTAVRILKHPLSCEPPRPNSAYHRRSQHFRWRPQAAEECSRDKSHKSTFIWGLCLWRRRRLFPSTLHGVSWTSTVTVWQPSLNALFQWRRETAEEYQEEESVAGVLNSVGGIGAKG